MSTIKNNFYYNETEVKIFKTKREHTKDILKKCKKKLGDMLVVDFSKKRLIYKDNLNNKE